MNIKYTQQLIEENIFERKRETIYKHSFTETEMNQFDSMFDNIVGPELNKIIELQDAYSHGMKYSVKQDVITRFIEQLYLLNCPTILKVNLIEQQFYLLYLSSILFYRFNERYIKLPINEFIDRVYFPNIISICSKNFIQSRRIIFKIIKQLYLEIKKNSSNTIDVYYELYHDNENSIKNDIMQLFLTNILPKFNPMAIDNIEEFYTVLFRRIFFFYLKSKTLAVKDVEINQSFLSSNNSNSIFESQSERFKIYEEAIYLSQIQQICSTSTVINNINTEFDKIKNLILPNEIQKLFLYKILGNKNSLLNQKVNLITMFTLNNTSVNSVKTKIPHVYRLLRSIHIMTPNSSFSEANKQYMREQFYGTLCSIFQHKIEINSIIPTLKTISENLVNSLTTGEYIDMISLTQIDITGQKFIDQFKEFLYLVLNNAFEVADEQIDPRN